MKVVRKEKQFPLLHNEFSIVIKNDYVYRSTKRLSRKFGRMFGSYLLSVTIFHFTCTWMNVIMIMVPNWLSTMNNGKIYNYIDKVSFQKNLEWKDLKFNVCL